MFKLKLDSNLRIWLKTKKLLFSDDWPYIQDLKKLINNTKQKLELYPKWFKNYPNEIIISCYIKINNLIFIKIK